MRCERSRTHAWQLVLQHGDILAQQVELTHHDDRKWWLCWLYQLAGSWNLLSVWLRSFDYRKQMQSLQFVVHH